jgi:glyoxylase-like metal-dependent hydrolase (beta-lactamase superfamily II)
VKVVALAALVSLAAVAVRAQQVPAAAGGIEVLHVRGNVYTLFGAGGNIVVSVGQDGVLMVDSGTSDKADAVLAAIRQVQRLVEERNDALEAIQPRWGAETRSTVIRDRDPNAPAKPVRYIINTSADAEHVGGNEKLSTSGRTFTGGNVAGDIRDAGTGAAILAHENVLVRMTEPPAGQPPASTRAIPTETYYVDTLKLSHFFNGEGVQLMNVPAGHTDGDSIVYFRGTDVIAAGDIFSNDTYPIIDVARGGSINGVVDGLNRILDLTFAEFRTEGGTMVVPGHGRIGDSADVAYYRDMVTIIRDRVQDMVKKGMTLDQVKASKPTADYDGRFGATSGRWTTTQFIEAVYRSLAPKATPAPAGAAPRGRTE